MRRADRLFRIVQMLRSGRLKTARALAERLQVSERTIYRDVRDLQLAGQPIEGESDLIAVNSTPDGTVTLVSPKRIFLSHDHGKTWSETTYPQYVTGIYNLTGSPDGALWLATREGALRSTDGGKTWEHTLGGLPPRNVFVVRYDPASQRLLATALHSHGVFVSKDNGQTWRQSPEAAVNLHAVLGYQGGLLAASSYNGLLLEQGTGTTAAEPANAGGGTSAATSQ